MAGIILHSAQKRTVRDGTPSHAATCAVVRKGLLAVWNPMINPHNLDFEHVSEPQGYRVKYTLLSPAVQSANY